MSTRRPRALDLFCGAGGAGMGLHRAGFDVVGVDIAPQPRYPFKFIQADALSPHVRLSDFDFIWASPPCQHYSEATPADRRASHPALIPPVRALLAASGRLTCMENTPRSPMRADVILDGTMFNLNTFRKRIFELNFPCVSPRRGKRFGPLSKPGAVTLAGHPGSQVSFAKARGRPASTGNIGAWRAAGRHRLDDRS